KTGAPVLWVHAALFVVAGIIRYIDMAAFEKADLAPDDADRAAHWEMRATIVGSLVALLYGTWCFSSLYIVHDPFAELSSMSTMIAAMVGIVTRNFGIDRLITYQSIAACLLLAAGLVLVG